MDPFQYTARGEDGQLALLLSWIIAPTDDIQDTDDSHTMTSSPYSKRRIGNLDNDISSVLNKKPDTRLKSS